MHQQHRPQHLAIFNHASGPLPKSDSIQSLVSLVGCAPADTSPPLRQPPPLTGLDADGVAHTAQLDNPSISLSGLALTSVSLSALSSPLSHTLRELSLAANAIVKIDLSPLASCTELTVLSLNSNRLATLNLAPLAPCVKLERLWLHDNNLTQIDLAPLSTCTALRSLYLEDNSIHDVTLNLSPLYNTQNLRSLRLGGNRLNAQLDLTPLLQCPALSVFNVDTAVKLTAVGESSQARVSPALRRIAPHITFHRPTSDTPVSSPLSSPSRRNPSSASAPPRLRRKVSPPRPLERPSSSPDKDPQTTSPIVKVVLVGFRRLARYAAEDSFARCGKVMIRASDQSVATTDPSLLLDSHLVLLHSPSERTLRQVTVVVGTIPTFVTGPERYRSSADTKVLQLLNGFTFFADPLDEESTKRVYHSGLQFATGNVSDPPAKPACSRTSATQLHRDSSPLSDEEYTHFSKARWQIRKSHSESSLHTAHGPVHIELEDIEDEDDMQSSSKTDTQFPRSRSADGINEKAKLSDGKKKPAMTWSEVSRRLTERKVPKTGRNWGSSGSPELSQHGKNKLRAERAAVQATFADLGGYASMETCAGIARSCGLPKCAGPVLFRAAFGSSSEIEATTPEAGVPNAPMERKKRISCDAFLAYWDARIKSYDGEERLSNILEDSHFFQMNQFGEGAGHSAFGAPFVRRSKSATNTLCVSYDGVPLGHLRQTRSMREGVRRFSDMQCSPILPSDLWCPCDAGIEDLIRSFMEGRSSRFGSYALVKMSEAIAIGSAMVIYGLRGRSKHRVGGRARPVCPKDVREGKLNAALIAAEVGIFEGVASGLSMNQIRSVKGCFSSGMLNSRVSTGSGLSVSVRLSLEEVQNFCENRKTLIPAAVERTFQHHCRDGRQMTLSEFSILLCVLDNMGSNGAVDYFFTVVDVDQNERWTVADLRHFHMEKEKMWEIDGLAVSDLKDFWTNLSDMMGAGKQQDYISRRDVLRLGPKERKSVIQSLLFMDDDYSLLNLRRTMELGKNSASTVIVM